MFYCRSQKDQINGEMAGRINLSASPARERKQTLPRPSPLEVKPPALDTLLSGITLLSTAEKQQLLVALFQAGQAS